MAFEIDYIPVGEGECSGDAIAIRFGDLTATPIQQSVVVIDAGFQDSAKVLVEHIKNFYKTTTIDLVISTHPDRDHLSGLSYVLENMTVKQLAMHQPWEHGANIKDLFKDGRITAPGIEKRLEECLQCASDLEALAKKKGITIVEPFQGVTGWNGLVHILGPSKEFYQSLLPSFRGLPSATTPFGVSGAVRQAATEAVKWIQDHVGLDLLTDEVDTTSAENNSSTVILFTIDGHKILFTGDAGKTSLTHAADYADSQSISLSDLSFLDVPHHGSKRNLNSKLLKRIKGATAYISAAKNSPKHPSKKLVNALKKHGMEVYTNEEEVICYNHNGPDRGWRSATPKPFYDQVEE